MVKSLIGKALLLSAYVVVIAGLTVVLPILFAVGIYDGTGVLALSIAAGILCFMLSVVPVPLLCQLMIDDPDIRRLADSIVGDRATG